MMISNTPNGIVIPRISPRLGPWVTGVIVPPLTVTSELWMGMPAIEFPDARLFVSVEYWLDA